MHKQGGSKRMERGRSSLEEFNAFAQCRIGLESFHGGSLSRKYNISTKALQQELERCKEHLGQMELQVIAAEAEVTSLGFQKVALEHELSQYKDKTKSLVEKLNAQASDMEKSEKNKQEVNRKLGVVRKALTKQLEELRSSEREMKLGFENIKRCVNQFKSEAITKDSFVSQVEALLDSMQSKHGLTNNFKLLKSVHSFDEKIQSTLQEDSSSFQEGSSSPLKEQPGNSSEPSVDSFNEKRVQGDDSSSRKSSPSRSPPPVPPRTSSSTVSQSPLMSRKPLPRPRKNISSHISLPSTINTSVNQTYSPGNDQQRTAVGRKPRAMRRRLSRTISRVDSLYSLAPPPGSPSLTQTAQVASFLFGNNLQEEWSKSSDSDSSDNFELFTPQRRRKRHNSEPRVKPLSKGLRPASKDTRRGSAPVVQKKRDVSPLSKSESQKKEEDEEEGSIKKSSPTMTRRPAWLFKKGKSLTSTNSTPGTRASSSMPTSVKEPVKRSCSLDDLLKTQEPPSVKQVCSEEPEINSDHEYTNPLEDSMSHVQPSQLVQLRQQFLGISTSGKLNATSMPNLQGVAADHSVRHPYEDDSDYDGIYINPDEVPARNSPKASFKESKELAKQESNTYLPLVELTRWKKTDIHVEAATPLTVPTVENDYMEVLSTSHTSSTWRMKYLSLQSKDSLPSGYTTDASSAGELSGNEEDNNEEVSSNIYEVPGETNYDSHRNSPVFDYRGYVPDLHDSSSSEHLDRIYEKIDLPDQLNDQAPGHSDSLLRNLKPLTSHRASPLLKHLPDHDLSGAYYSVSDTGLQEDHGYACVRDIQKGSGVRNQAPSLPPRPARMSTQLPGTGSLPRHSLEENNHQVTLVPLDKTHSLRETDYGYGNQNGISSSLPTTTHVSKPVGLKRRVTHSPGTPNLLEGLSREGSGSEPRSPSPHHTPKKSVVTDPKRTHTLSYPGESKMHSQGFPAPLLEKSGYLEKIDPKKEKKSKKKWFVLKGTELKCYSGPARKGTKKAQAVVNLDKWCKLMTTEKETEFQLATTDKEYIFKAASKDEREEWLKVIEAAMQGFASSSTTEKHPDGDDEKDSSLSGWASVDGNTKSVWCSLDGTTLSLSVEPETKPYRHINIGRCTVQWKRDSILLDSSEQSHSNLRARVLTIRNKDTREVTTIQPITEEDKEEWFYLLNTQCGDLGPELTRTEKLLSEIMKDNPISHREHQTWRHPVLNYSHVALRDPLISLPSAGLKLRAKNVSRDLQDFMSTQIEGSVIKYHISLAQKIIGQCLAHSHLQNEVYCLLLRQLSGHTNLTTSLVLQGWLLLLMLIPMYLPTRKIVSWYLKVSLDRFTSSKNQLMCDLARNCRERVKLSESNGPRQCTPTYFELHTVMSEFIKSPLAPPSGVMRITVSLPDKTSHEIGFNSSTTVNEFTTKLTEQVGLPSSATTGFALMCDWPGVNEVLCCPFPESKMCDVISMWSISLEELNHLADMTNLAQRISFFYRKRLSFRKHRASESNYGCVLLAHQISGDVLTGVHPVPSTEQAIHLTAIMAQLEYGDWKSLNKDKEMIAREALERFCPYKYTHLALEHKWQQLQSELVIKWSEFEGKSKDECAQIYLENAYLWSLCGASLFRAEEPRNGKQSHRTLWLAIHEDGISLLDHHSMEVKKYYHYSEIATFGGHRGDNFILMVSPQMSPVGGEDVVTRGEKLMLSMSKIQICEATFLMATYIECVKAAS